MMYNVYRGCPKLFCWKAERYFSELFLNDKIRRNFRWFLNQFSISFYQEYSLETGFVLRKLTGLQFLDKRIALYSRCQKSFKTFLGNPVYVLFPQAIFHSSLQICAMYSNPYNDRMLICCLNVFQENFATLIKDSKRQIFLLPTE